MKKWRLPIKDKEEKVCELLKQGKGYREISKVLHVSYTFIEKTKKKYFQTDDAPENSKRSQVLQMMEEDKSSLEIAKELNLSSDEIKDYRKEYLTLIGDDQLLESLARIGPNKESFVQLHEMMTKDDLDPHEAVWTIQDMGGFKNVQKELINLAKKLRPLREAVDRLKKEGQEWSSEVERRRDEADEQEMRNEQIRRENAELRKLNAELQKLHQQLASTVQFAFRMAEAAAQNSEINSEPEGQLDLDWIGKLPGNPEDGSHRPHRGKKRSTISDE